MIKLRLMRTGKTNQPYFRIVAIEKEAGPKADFLEILGNYSPIKDQFVIDKEKLEKWLKNGAQPSDTLNNLLVKNEVFPKTKLIKKTVKPKAKKEKEEKPTPPVQAGPEEKTEEKSETPPAQKAKPEEKSFDAAQDKKTPLEQVQEEPKEEPKKPEAVEKPEPKAEEAKKTEEKPKEKTETKPA